jgi:hypothetical protein
MTARYLAPAALCLMASLSPAQLLQAAPRPATAPRPSLRAEVMTIHSSGLDSVVLTYADYLRAVDSIKGSWDLIVEDGGGAANFPGVSWRDEAVGQFLPIELLSDVLSSDLAEMRWQARRVQELALAGEDWDELIKTRASKVHGPPASWDRATVRDLPAPLPEVVWAMKEGEVSAPVLTRYGYSVAKLHEILETKDGQPERRNVSHCLISWPVYAPKGASASVVVMVSSVMQTTSVEILDERICVDIPATCQAAGIGPGVAPE